MIEAGIDELSRYTGAPAGDGALEDATDELIHQLHLAEQIRDELETAFPLYVVERNIELPLEWPRAA